LLKVNPSPRSELPGGNLFVLNLGIDSQPSICYIRPDIYWWIEVDQMGFKN